MYTLLSCLGRLRQSAVWNPERLIQFRSKAFPASWHATDTRPSEKSQLDASWRGECAHKRCGCVQTVFECQSP